MQPRPGRSCGLEYHWTVVQRTVLHHQDPVTGLLPAHQISGCEEHAWIRDNVYSITAVWALAMAYRRQGEREGQARSYLLEKATVRCMRGLLLAMMGQREKVEKFKSSFSLRDSLHAKYCSRTGEPVVGDTEWGHLQIDAVSLYLLSLAQMTAGGLQVVFTLDEVAFVQNLVFYIECAYVTPDYGVWERGAKSNQGIPELNASSIGMAKAALEALSELDLFGGGGSPASVIHTLPDEAVKCAAVLESMLPRESNSKETDAAVLGVIGFPAFAVNNAETIGATLATVREKLGGRYGFKRFLRDGYKTLREDTGRLHYEPWELRVFDSIECEWPLFLCYIAINHLFCGEQEQAEDCLLLLDSLSVPCSGLKLLPELYLVPEGEMVAEQARPGSVDRLPAGRMPFMWAQSLLVVARLLQENLLAPAEIDPMNRRLSATSKPDVVVQVVVLAENQQLQALLAEQGVRVQTVQQVSPMEVAPAAVLSHLYTFLGRSSKLGLSGRSCLDVGILATSKIYSIQGKVFVFTPQNFDRTSNYMDTDTPLAMSTLAYSINYLATSWSSPGRPTVTLLLTTSMLEGGRVPAPIVTTIRKVESGYIAGTRTMLGTHAQFSATSCTAELAFLGDIEEGRPEVLDPKVAKYLQAQFNSGLEVREGVLGTLPRRSKEGERRGGGAAMSGAMRRSRSICPSAETSRSIALELERLEGEMQEEGAREGQESKGEMQGIREEAGGKVPAPRRRLETDREVNYEDIELEELLYTLRGSQDMEVQGDILHYMAATHGMQFHTGLGTVNELLKELYASACSGQQWGIVRHTSGLLGKRIPNIALSLTDLLVRQKQVTIGLPPHHELILSQPLGAKELFRLIQEASGGDMAAAALSQEILVLLAMFVRTEPSLFHGMLRLRVGLILQVMVSEFSRSLPHLSDEESTDRLLNLSPFETKNLLHHLLSGQEYWVSEVGGLVVLKTEDREVSCSLGSRKASILTQLSQGDREEEEGLDMAGLWLRRRLLDGSLNRVPPGFYTRVWSLIDRCQGLEVGGTLLPSALTQEMTSGEMAFHLRCEALLNSVPEPEFRQLVMEAILILVLMVEHKVVEHLGGVIKVEEIVKTANTLFLADQAKQNGDATLCCVSLAGKCGSAAGVCEHFYDSAPSGPWGTMTYLVRGACSHLNCIPSDGEMECSIM